MGFATEIPDTLTMLNSAFSSLAALAAQVSQPFSSPVSKRESRWGASLPKPQVMESPINSMESRLLGALAGRSCPPASSHSRAVLPNWFSESFVSRRVWVPSSPEKRVYHRGPPVQRKRWKSSPFSSATPRQG